MTDWMRYFKSHHNGIALIEHVVDEEEVKLVPLGDVHLGAPTCQVRKFAETVDYIHDSGSLCVLMGDLAECASKGSVGAGWVEQVITPQAQLEALTEVLTPIASQVLVLLDGNHEDRIWKQTGLQFSKILARLLGVRYGGYSCFIKLRVQKQNYIIHAQHGASNAWYPHTKLTAAMRTAQHTDADCYLYGHKTTLCPYSVRSSKKQGYIGETLNG